MNKPIDYRRNKTKQRFAPNFEKFEKNTQNLAKNQAELKNQQENPDNN